MRGRVSSLAVIGAFAVVLAWACAAQAKPYYLSYHKPTAPPKKGVVLVIHGGGWEGDYGPEADTIMSLFLGDFQSWGYRTFNLAFRDGHALQDTYAAVRHLDRRYPRRPLCVFGGSSGGHLALMAAIGRPKKVDCVIDIGGPIDFIRPEPARPYWYSIRDRAAEVFGAQNLRAVSPIYQTRKIEAPVLIASAECDIYTSIERNRDLVARLDRGRVLPLRFDPTGFNLGGHCPIAYEDFAAMRSAERAWLGRWANKRVRKRR